MINEMDISDVFSSYGPYQHDGLKSNFISSELHHELNFKDYAKLVRGLKEVRFQLYLY